MINTVNLDNHMAELEARVSAIANKYGIDFSSNNTTSKPAVLTEQERRNIKQAAVLNNTSDEVMFSNCLAFLQPDMTGGYQAPSIGMMRENAEEIQQQQRNIKQAAISKTNKAKPEDVLDTFRSFGGF